MKICFIGSHGVGKTTIAKEISRRLNIEYVSEVALYIKNVYKLPLFPNSTENTQLMIFLEQLKRELSIEEGVFDRCLVDNVAYSIAENLFNNNILNKMIEIVKVTMKEFDYIFFVTRFKDFIDSEEDHRDGDLIKHMRIEHIIEHLLTECNIKYYIIFERNISDRIEKVMGMITPYMAH